MISKPLDAITKADIDALVADGVAEGRALDYKGALPGNSDEDKREFLADVSSMANASGGDILFGVSEAKDASGKNTGLPESAAGLRDVNQDAEMLRLESIIRDGIAPRLPAVQPRFIGGFADGPVLLVRVRQSWAQPHTVTYKNWSRFFSRNSAGKYQLDVGEIRAAFAVSEAFPERVRQFRLDRLARIVAGETPVEIDSSVRDYLGDQSAVWEGSGRFVLHLFPASAAEPGANVDIVQASEHWRELEPIAQGGNGYRYNFDGWLNFGPQGSRGGRTGYTQLFRNGAIEAVDASLLRPNGPTAGTEIPPIYEHRVIQAVKAYVGVLGTLGVTPPVFVMLTVLGARGYEITAESAKAWGGGVPIDRETLVVPEALLDDFTSDVALTLRPMFDAIWQAAGWPRSLNYNDDGKWVGR